MKKNHDSNSRIDAFFGQTNFLAKLNQMNCCAIISVNQKQLHNELEMDLARAGLDKPLLESHPHLFAQTPVFISQQQFAQIKTIINAIDTVCQSLPYQNAIAKWAPDIFQFKPDPKGVYFGYDFHLGVDGPRLIEINTNAGGALLNAYLARAQIACCKPVSDNLAGIIEPVQIENQYMEMFLNEWSLQHPGSALDRIAIVDEDPVTQGMYPEFVLFQRLFEKNGIETIISGPENFTFNNEELQHEGKKIDLVYNRHCDFYLEDKSNAALKKAYIDRAAVITPHPRAYALYADKRNLTLLSNKKWLEMHEFPSDLIDTLTTYIPETIEITRDNADDFWGQRKQHFFKPVSGFGSKAVYRGAKLTKKVWAHISQGGYVAQKLILPGERHIKINQQDAILKVDLRAYVYSGKIQLLAARLYRGQTTNMKTSGGGFAAVFTEAR